MSLEQFGYHTDTFQYCRYLRDDYRITFLSTEKGLPRKSLSGVEVVYARKPPLGRNELGILRDALALLSSRTFDIMFMGRLKFGWVLRLLHAHVPMVFDVRTGSINQRRWRRWADNALVPWNAVFFRNITVVSAAVGRYLRLPSRAHVLPLAADRPQSLASPRRDELKLVYVGTFTNRYIERAIEGFADFVGRHGDAVPASFTLIGFGSEDDERMLRDTSHKRGVSEQVEIQGRIDHDELSGVLAQHNVGVAFTPRVPWYEYQPSTKVFEYAQSGLLVLATDNFANREWITAENGVLIDDTAPDFCKGLEHICDLLPSWQPEIIAERVKDHTWERIVAGNLAPYLREILQSAEP